MLSSEAIRTLNGWIWPSVAATSVLPNQLWQQCLLILLVVAKLGSAWEHDYMCTGTRLLLSVVALAVF